MGMDRIGRRSEYLFMVAECGSVRSAAERLGINPSVVSRQLRELERDVGMPIMERNGRYLSLTEAGRTVVDNHMVRRQLDRELEHSLERLRHRQAGKVVVAVGEGFVDSLVDSVLRRVAAQYPDVFIELLSGIYYPREPHEMVLADEVDIAITYGPEVDPRLVRHTFSRGPLCALMSPHHPLSSHDRLSLKELSSQKLIFLPPGSGSQMFLESLFRSEQLMATPAYRCNLHSTARRMAIAGIGITFMTRMAAGQDIETGKLRAIPVDHPLAHETCGNLIRRAGRRMSPAADYLWKLMTSMR